MARRGAPLILVSNRGPLTFTRGPDGELRSERSGGGLVTALLGLTEHTPALWISAAISEAEEEMSRVAGGGSFPMPDVGRRHARALRDDRRRDVPRLLQRGRQPHALVHPALPLGPEQRARHPPRGADGLEARLPGRQPGVRRGGQRGAGGGPGPGRDASRLPPLHGPRDHPRGASERVPALLRAHPVEPVGLLAHPAQQDSRGDPARDAGQRHHRVPHLAVRAQLPPLLRGAARPARRLRPQPGALAGARRVGAVLPHLGQRAHVRGAGAEPRGEGRGGPDAAAPAPAPDRARRPHRPLEEHAARLQGLRHLPGPPPRVPRGHHVLRAPAAVPPGRGRVRRVRGEDPRRREPHQHQAREHGLDADRPAHREQHPPGRGRLQALRRAAGEPDLRRDEPDRQGGPAGERAQRGDDPVRERRGARGARARSPSRSTRSTWRLRPRRSTRR